MSRKALLLSLVLSPALTGAFVASRAAGPFFAEEPPAIPGKPYSAMAKTQSVTVFSDGNRVVRGNTVRFFRDRQGRTRTERGVGAAGTAQPALITINDPVSGERYVLHPQNKTVDIFKLRAGLASAPVEDESLDVNAPFALLGFRMGIGASPLTEASSATTSLGQKTVDGLTVAGTKLVRTIPTGVLGNEKPITSTLERWVSTDLDVPVQIIQKSSIGGEVTLTLSNVVRAEPDAALFTPPADYTRRQIGMPVSNSVPAAAAAVAPVKTP